MGKRINDQADARLWLGHAEDLYKVGDPDATEAGKLAASIAQVYATLHQADQIAVLGDRIEGP